MQKPKCLFKNVAGRSLEQWTERDYSVNAEVLSFLYFFWTFVYLSNLSGFYILQLKTYT